MENRKKYIVILLAITCVMVVGFAVLSTSISLDGTTTLNANTWNVKFQNIVEDTENNVTATTAPSISSNTSISFAVTLNEPGDKYSFTVDVVNAGSIDAMIDTISKSSLSTEQSEYLDYKVTYSDGIPIQQKDILVKTNGTEKIKVTLEFKDIYDPDLLPSSADNINLTFGLKYVQADNTAKETLSGFITKAKAGNATSSDVGKTFIVDLGRIYGEHTLRVANVSKPTACNGSDFSKTACGVVMEFTDIITNEVINSSDWNDKDDNVGGWPSSYMRTYLNNNIYNLFPTTLKNAIINTTVVSGHGSTSGETNFTSTDKLYLLSAHEVWEDDDNNTSDGIDYFDTSYNNTRQLDYYSKLNVTTSSYSNAIKQFAESDTAWWLRSANFENNYAFLAVTDPGDWSGITVNEAYGVSPAFRIA